MAPLPAPPNTATVGKVRLQSSRRSSRDSVTATCRRNACEIQGQDNISVSKGSGKGGGMISASRAGMPATMPVCLSAYAILHPDALRTSRPTSKGSLSVCNSAARSRWALFSCLHNSSAVSVLPAFWSQSRLIFVSLEKIILLRSNRTCQINPTTQYGCCLLRRKRKPML